MTFTIHYFYLKGPQLLAQVHQHYPRPPGHHGQQVVSLAGYDQRVNMLTMMIYRWSWLLQLMCLVLYQRTGQIELLKILLDQFTKEELVEEDSARK